MGVLAKVALSLIVLVVGAIGSGVVKELYEFGSSFVILIAVLIVFYIWKKSPNNPSVEATKSPNLTLNNQTLGPEVNCSSCGAEITPRDAKFCKHCGTKVEQVITTSTTVKAEVVKPPTIEKKIIAEAESEKIPSEKQEKKVEKTAVYINEKRNHSNGVYKNNKEILFILFVFVVFIYLIFTDGNNTKVTAVKDKNTYYGTFAYDNGDTYEGQLKDGRPTFKKGYQLKYKYSTSFIAPNSKIHQEVKRIRPNINCLAIYKGTNFNAHDAYICEQDFKNKIALKVKKHWRYQGAKKDWGCDVHILQDIDGNVQSVNVQSCVVDNSAESKSFKNSIERAVYKASPLPLSPNSVFTSWSEEQILSHGISLETAFQTKFYFKVD